MPVWAQYVVAVLVIVPLWSIAGALAQLSNRSDASAEWEAPDGSRVR